MRLTSLLRNWRTIHIRRDPPPDRRPRMPHDLVAWIGAGRRPFADYSVTGLVPGVFSRYARIFHPAWSADEKPVQWETVAAWSGRVMHRLAQWDYLSVPVGASPTEPPFHAPPDEGELRRSVASTILDLLTRHTTTPNVGFIGVWEGYGGIDEEEMGPDVLDLEERAFLVRRIPILGAADIGWRDERESNPPTLIWPADRAWFLAGDIDLDTTYVGGSSDLIDGLLACRELEVREVFPGDGVFLESDVVNAPKATP